MSAQIGLEGLASLRQELNQLKSGMTTLREAIANKEKADEKQTNKEDLKAKIGHWEIKMAELNTALNALAHHKDKTTVNKRIRRFVKLILSETERTISKKLFLASGILGGLLVGLMIFAPALPIISTLQAFVMAYAPFILSTAGVVGALLNTSLNLSELFQNGTLRKVWDFNVSQRKAESNRNQTDPWATKKSKALHRDASANIKYNPITWLKRGVELLIQGIFHLTDRGRTHHAQASTPRRWFKQFFSLTLGSLVMLLEALEPLLDRPIRMCASLLGKSLSGPKMYFDDLLADGDIFVISNEDNSTGSMMDRLGRGDAPTQGHVTFLTEDFTSLKIKITQIANLEALLPAIREKVRYRLSQLVDSKESPPHLKFVTRSFAEDQLENDDRILKFNEILGELLGISKSFDQKGRIKDILCAQYNPHRSSNELDSELSLDVLKMQMTMIRFDYYENLFKQGKISQEEFNDVPYLPGVQRPEETPSSPVDESANAADAADGIRPASPVLFR